MEPETLQPAVVNKKRCPKGTRKNKQGDCVPAKGQADEGSTPIETDKPNVVPADAKRPKCPKGTRKNKQGDCEPILGKKMPSPTPAAPIEQSDAMVLPPDGKDAVAKGEQPLMDEDDMVFRPEDLDDNDVLAELEKQLTSPFGRTDADVPPPPPAAVAADDKRKRCPKGQRRDKQGNCVPINPNAPPLATGVAPVAPVQPAPSSMVKSKQPSVAVAPKTDAQIDAEEDGRIRNMNQLLKHKEYTEHKNPATWDFLYPELNDPNFNIKIYTRL
jgi:hypothetical protein